MRVPKKFTERTPALKSNEVREKYFLVFEGEKTEVLYFEGIINNRKKLQISPLIEIKPLLRNFNQSKIANPKTILDLLLVYIDELKEDYITLDYIIKNIIEFMIDDDIIGKNCVLDNRNIKREIKKYFSNQNKNLDQEFKKNDMNNIKKIIEEVMDCLKDIANLSHIIPNLENYILNQNVVYDSEIDTINLIVDRDKDSFTSNQYNYVLNKCNKHNIDFYLTNPCFEFWLLLHFDDVYNLDKDKLLQNKKLSTNRTYAHGELCKIVQGYKKNDIKFESYVNNIDNAILNQKKFCEDIHELEYKIGTNLGNLINKLRKK